MRALFPALADRASVMLGASASVTLAACAVLMLAACPPADPGAPDGGAPASDAGLGDECTQATAADDCSDGDPCTDDLCVSGLCTWSRKAPGLTRLAAMPTAGDAAGVHLTSSRLHVAAGAAGVQTFDLRPLPEAEPVLEVTRPTASPALAVHDAGPVVLAIEGPGGVEVFPAGTDGTAPLSTYTAGDEVRGVGRVDQLMITYAFGKGLDVADVSDWALPARQARVDTRGRAYDAVLYGRYILVADGLAGLAWVHFEDRTAPRLEDRRIETEGRVVAVSRRDAVVTLAETGAGLGVIDLRAEGGPARIATLMLEGDVHDVDMLSRHTVAVAAGEGGLVLVDLIDPERPAVWTHAALEGPAVSVDLNGERVAVGMGAAGAAVYELGCTVPEAGE